MNRTALHVHQADCLSALTTALQVHDAHLQLAIMTALQMDFFQDEQLCMCMMSAANHALQQLCK